MDSYIVDVPEQHPCFPGHFPSQPLVPGALLLAWINDVLEREMVLSITTIKSSKFLKPVLPGVRLVIQIAKKSESNMQVLGVIDGKTALKISLVYE